MGVALCKKALHSYPNVIKLFDQTNTPTNGLFPSKLLTTVAYMIELFCLHMITFIEEILNEKLHSLCSENAGFVHPCCNTVKCI